MGHNGLTSLDRRQSLPQIDRLIDLIVTGSSLVESTFMVMPISGTFNYRVQVKAGSGSPTWIGEATSLHRSDLHPGLVGYQPRFELSNGRVTLRSTESAHSLSADEHFTQWPPASAVSYEAGEILADLLEIGDVLLLRRDGMGAKSLCVVCKAELILALGALTGSPLPGNDAVHLQEDPRTEQRHDYLFADLVRNRKANVLWIEPIVEDIASSLLKIERLSPDRPLIIVYRGVDQRSFYDELHRRTRRFASVSFAPEPRFASVETWLAYLMQLPDRRPDDLELHFRVGEREVRLGPGQETSIGPFILRAEQVNWSIEWHRSAAAVVRQAEEVDRAAWRGASALMASDQIDIIGVRAGNRRPGF